MVIKEIILAPTRLGLAGYGLQHGKVARLWLPGQNEKTLTQAMAAWAGYGKPAVQKTPLAERITAYFAGEAVDFPEQVDLAGLTEFQTVILTTLRRKIKRGQTTTYRELAELAGKPGAARAVGSVMAANPVPLIIPCHRVLRGDGGVGGFSGPGGEKLKKLMLELETSGKPPRIK